MANYYAQSSIAASTGETADVNCNVFAFIGPAVFTSTEGEFVGDTISAFYNRLNDNAVCMRGRAQNGHSIKIYVATTTPPNYPIDEYSFNLTNAPGALDLPSEMALCVSYANDSATIVPRARRRGRIYLSGFAESQNTTGRPTAVTYEGLVTEYSLYCDEMNAEADFSAGIWSRTNATIYPIERVWADNEWDTQRSRGGKSTARDTQTITP